jgi:hypothetical protein
MSWWKRKCSSLSRTENNDLSKCILIDGQMWTDFPFDTGLLQPDGITIHVSGDVILSAKKENVLNSPNHFWIPRSSLPPIIKDIIAYSKVFVNNRYNLKNKKYEGPCKDLCFFQSEIPRNIDDE